MMDEKTYNKMVAANLRRLMPCRKYIATPLIMSIWNTRRKPSARSKIHSKTNRRTNKKSPAKRQIQRSTGLITAGSGGRTRTSHWKIADCDVIMPISVSIHIVFVDFRM